MVAVISMNGGVNVAPKNGMVAKIEAKYKAYYEALFHTRVGMILQIGQDAGCFAANEVFKMGAGRAADYCVAYRESVNEMVKLIFEDQNDDKEFVYSKAKIDERLKAIVGEKNFAPWEERYGIV